VAEIDKIIVVGYAGIWLIIDEGHITNIAVEKEFQGLGISNYLEGLH
jgi:ribosomal-protein-alanine N-acetyltransferase